jgi:hypothetical protein
VRSFRAPFRGDPEDMNRGLWFVAGAGTAIYAMVRGRRAAEALTIDGMQDRLNGLAVGLRMFRDEVAQGRAEAEYGLRERFALVPHGSNISGQELTSREEEEGS